MCAAVPRPTFARARPVSARLAPQRRDGAAGTLFGAGSHLAGPDGAVLGRLRCADPLHGREDDVADAQDEAAGDPLQDGHSEHGPSWATSRSMVLLEHAQDGVSVIVGVVLVALAGVLLVSGLVNFSRGLFHSAVLDAANNLLDRVLLVLILVEIVHTVVLSLRAHTLVPQPFIVVGLVAVIRKILFILGSSQRISTAELALLIAMVAVFVAGLIAVNIFGRARSGAGRGGDRSS